MTTSQSPFPGAIPAAFPANEAERIQKLLGYQVLDTAAETSYDDITEIAASICNTATSMVSLVDVSRQWFKSAVGLDITEIHRDLGFCAHAILKPEVLVIPDTQADDRFANNPLVVEAPHIRFYAGAPLITSEGYALGTLCVIDNVPKQLNPKQIQTLEALARQVVILLETRLTVQRVQAEIAKQRKTENALRQAHVKLKARTETIYQKNQQLEQALQQLRLTQSQLIQQKKMVSLGRMVAGIAHEINNPVSFIAGNIAPAQQHANDLLKLVSLYQKEHTTPSKTIQTLAEEMDMAFLVKDFSQLLTSMEAGSQRITNIVKALKTFAHLDESERKPVNIQAGLEATLMILQHRLNAQAKRPEIKVLKSFASLPLVTCCAASLNQVFMHVLANAIDALEAFYWKQITPQRTHPLNKQSGLDATWLPEISIKIELLDAHEVVIAIADNGPGIPCAIKDRLFDPFFTTKPVGQGLGLGLSVSHTIMVEQHNGSLECFPEPDQGTRFVIKLPVRGANE